MWKKNSRWLIFERNVIGVVNACILDNIPLKVGTITRECIAIIYKITSER